MATHTTTVGHATVTINTEAVTSAWRNANRHTATAIAARRAGDDFNAWKYAAHARFYRDVALAYITGTAR